jgi:hypothetical protein
MRRPPRSTTGSWRMWSKRCSHKCSGNKRSRPWLDCSHFHTLYTTSRVTTVNQAGYFSLSALMADCVESSETAGDLYREETNLQVIKAVRDRGEGAGPLAALK